MVAAALDLPVGTASSATDMPATKIPPGMLTAGAISHTGEAAGKQLAAPLRKGQLVTDSLLLGPGLPTGTPPGSAPVPSRLADPSSIQPVSPGRLVSALLTGPRA